jgi:xylulose-5-phosphate/fructose-6-phosphate phosphoketolase
VKQAMRERLIEHRAYISEHGDDMPEIRGWRWGASRSAERRTSTEGDNV